MFPPDLVFNNVIKVAATDISFFDIQCESMVETTVQNFRLLFFIEIYFKGLLRYCDKLRQGNKQIFVEYYRSGLNINHEIT